MMKIVSSPKLTFDAISQLIAAYFPYKGVLALGKTDEETKRYDRNTQFELNMKPFCDGEESVATKQRNI